MKKIKPEDIFTALATAASIISLAFVSGISPWLRTGICTIGIISFAYFVYKHCIKSSNQYIYCDSEEKTRLYLKKWVMSQGKVCVVSRDLSWVDDEIQLQMQRKGSSLTIYAQKETALTQTLQRNGVVVKYYHNKFEPTTRFTIIRYNRDDRQIAIATPQSRLDRKRGESHIIYQSGTENDDLRDKWIVSLAKDLSVLLEKICDQEAVDHVTESEKPEQVEEPCGNCS